ncbi:MAG: hypothetical protein JNM31_10755 [Flavobacteriales bacterium]|nr:hypothetical protein [Flavobacteriales bacterium]
MRFPKWFVALFAFLFLTMFAVLTLMMQGRNPLPFPDHGSRIFSAATPEAKQAMVDLLEQYGVHERFQANSGGVLRSIFYDGTIIYQASEEVLAKLGNVYSCIGLVADDPLTIARSAADFLQQRGSSAQVVEEIEPGLPIAFVLTDALPGTAINFRPHVTKMPKPE